jgi:hypothetical protein
VTERLDMSLEIDPREVPIQSEEEREPPSHSPVLKGPSPENIPEVNSLTIPSNLNDMDIPTVGYTLTYRHNRANHLIDIP